MILRSNPKNVSRVEGFLEKVGAHIPLDEIQFNKLMVALTEAVNNAIVHGNRSRPEKRVFVTCSVLDGVIDILVRDEGRGFRPETVESPLKEENLLRESGRGIFLMRTLMDKVEFVRFPHGMETHLRLDLNT
jgi:serine/threonine-protein kinase RsbW